VAADNEIDLNDARPRRWGWWALLIGFGGFMAWALLAPLDAGVSAPGSVVVTGNRKAVQPLAGGKIAAVLAKDGDTVTAGQVLVRLDDTASRSQLDVTKGQWLTSVVTEARLLAERAGRASIEAPAALGADAADPRATAALSLQRQLLATRRQALASELAAMKENQRGLELQIQGLEAARSAKEEQLSSLRQQLASQKRLADEGFLPRNRVLELERSVAAAGGAVAEDTGNLGRYRQSIAELRVRMLGREQETRKEVEAQLADTQREASALRSRLDALQFDLANTEIRSPANGRVMGLAVHTVGGVVAAGSPRREVVPGNEALRIDAQLAPHLIDKVRPGLAVDVLFPALNQATTPHVPGRVLDVSADVLNEPRLNNQPYFKLTVEITPEGMALLKSHDIRAGMPVEVFVRTGERTAMNYLLKPLRDRLNRALTEP
jgi:protease secretion system membrane fusion protein